MLPIPRRARHRPANDMVDIIRVTLEGIERVVELETPTMDELRETIAAAFDSTSTSKEFAFLARFSPDRREVVLDTDRDLVSVLETCPVVEVHVIRAHANKPRTKKVESFYETAARSLRTAHGVPSISAASLKQAIALLRLSPQRLVAQGLIPRWSPRSQKVASPSDGGRRLDNDSADLMSDYEDTDAEIDCQAERDHLRAEIAKLHPKESPVRATTELRLESIEDYEKSLQQEGLESDNVNEEQHGENLVHGALLRGRVDVHPHETSALLHALGVDARRLVRLGLISRNALQHSPCLRAARSADISSNYSTPSHPGEDSDKRWAHRTVRLAEFDDVAHALSQDLKHPPKKAAEVNPSTKLGEAQSGEVGVGRKPGRGFSRAHRSCSYPVARGRSIKIVRLPVRLVGPMRTRRTPGPNYAFSGRDGSNDTGGVGTAACQEEQQSRLKLRAT